MAKVKCPRCDTEATWRHQFFKHFIGAHVKGQSDLSSIINNLNEESEVDFEANQQSSKNALIRFDKDKRNKLIERINNFEPLEENESTIQNGTSDGTSLQDKYDLKEFIGRVCREERQYALFLANALSEQKPDIKQIVGLEGHTISEVFYEATLMRDYWHQDKARFNKKLWEYVIDKPGKNKKKWPIIEKSMVDLKEHANYWPDRYSHPLARWMMNAKPDIAIISKYNGDYYLSFIECKYLSGQDTYRCHNQNNTFELNQLEVQEHILNFLLGITNPNDSTPILVYDKTKLNKLGKGVFLLQFIGDHYEPCEGLKGEEFHLNLKKLIN